MKEVNADRMTRMALPSATSTWRTAAKHERAPVLIAPAHLEKEQQLENALDEYCQLRENDRSLTASRFCERYPSYRQSLRRLIDVHEAMEGQPALDDENWPELFTEFLGYEILHELGVGAIARVYLAAESALGGRLVAIKVAQAGGDEAETLGKLVHPNIVPVFSVKHDEQSGLTAVCMPYHGSATLADLLEIGFQHGTPPTKARVILDAAREREQIVDFVEEIAAENQSRASADVRGNYVDGVVRLGIQMAAALAYTHERGILHRDLKPSNVLLTPHGEPMLLDFNLASDIATGSHHLGGTLPYMPPEQIRDVHLQPFAAEATGDPRSDIFSLGVILYELLTGRLPFGDPPAAVAPRQAAEAFLAAQQQDPPSVRSLNPLVSPKLGRLLHQCLALEPDKRPASAAELESDLKKYFSPRRRVQRWTSRHRGMVTTFVLVFMAIFSAAIWHLETRPPYPVRRYQAALADIHAHRYSEAIDKLDEAIRLDENCVAFRFARGVVYQRLGQYLLSGNDLNIAFRDANDPVISECLAFSQMKAGGLGALSARAKYATIAKTKRVSPEFELNWAFSNFDTKPSPTVVIVRCDSALRLRNDWQDAHYLRALAHFDMAKKYLTETKNSQMSPEERERKLTESLRAARSDFDKAIELGPPSARLFTDAARAYAMADPSQSADTARLQQLLEPAAKHGAPQILLIQIGSGHAWSQDAWFQAVVASCSNLSNTFSEADYHDRFLTAPDADAVARRLNWYPVQLQPRSPKPAELLELE